MADFDVPELQEYSIVPKLEEGTMAHSAPFIAKAKFQEPLGYPGELVDNWEEKVITKMDDLRGKYRGFQVFLDSCVKCGACTDKCHYF
ncbi:MAG: (Fe-S)-binding protein, partial [Gammaproteobacteria bacterium]|nr:(Fe-S)-binding protein [Gammaproteobacteria bacterium]